MVSEEKNQTLNSTSCCVDDSLLKNDCNSTVFYGLFYLGCASLNAPRNQTETLRLMSILRSPHEEVNNDSYSNNAQSDVNASSQQIKINLSVPNNADGLVRILEPQKSSVISSIKLHTILFCTRGNEQLPDCFALTEYHQSKVFQCHVFRCDTPKAVNKVTHCFNYAFRQTLKDSPEKQTPTPSSGLNFLKRSSSSSEGTSTGPSQLEDKSVFSFAVSIEVKEDDGKGGYGTVPWDKNSSCYKFRQNHVKEFNINVTQTSNLDLTIERCFGILLGAGRDVKQNEMHLLDLESPSSDFSASPGSPHSVSGLWDPAEPQFKLLNTGTTKGNPVPYSVAIDLVIREVQEPVRFLVESQASIYSQGEKFWSFGNKVLHESFLVRLNEISSDAPASQRYTIVSVESKSQHYKFSANALSEASSHTDEDPEDDTDEPLMSGSGEVSMECSEKVLAEWGKALNQWRQDLSRCPPLVRKLVRSGSGVPEALRGEVWQLLSGCFDNEKMLEEYRLLIAADSSQQSIIERDIHRTFPAHEYFRESGGTGQESLYRISKAYSVYDKEVGYSQGLSFLAAALLLHMPEEQAFCVLVNIMYDYKMRDMFKSGFEELHLSFYILDRLIEDLMPNLHKHFRKHNVETHMFSSQWFLTLFTAKFPLNMVYHVLDIFLCEGQLVVFKVAVALLEGCRSDLLQLDFEGVLKYFRNQLPKRYRDDEQVKALGLAAVGVKLTWKKLLRYKKDYQAEKEKMNVEDPVQLMQKENKSLMDTNLRLEIENDDVARELATSQVTLLTQLDRTKEHSDDLKQELNAVSGELHLMKNKETDLMEENKRLQDEATQVKEMCRREMARQESEITAKTKIISDYKAICNQLSERLQSVEAQNKQEIELVKNAPDHVTDDVFIDCHESVSDVTNDDIESLRRQTRALELDLAQTKLKLVEAECRVQDLEHDLTSANKVLHGSKPNTWFQKKFLSFSNVKKSENSVEASSSGAAVNRQTSRCPSTD